MKALIKPVGAAVRWLPLALLALGGCGPLVEFGESGPPPDLYSLSRYDVPSDIRPDGRLVILVEQPVAAAEIMSDRLAIRMDGNEIRYFSGAQWSDRPVNLFRDRLLEGMESVPGVVAVTIDSLEVGVDYKIKVRLRDLNAEYRGEGVPPDVRFRASAILLKNLGADVVDQRAFEYEESAGANTAGAVVNALDGMTHRAIGDIVAWMLETIGSDADERPREVSRRKGP